VTDEELSVVRRFHHLKRLNLRNHPITDVGIRHLSLMKELEDLDLDGTQIQGSGLRHLRNMPHLKYINLWDTPLTDKGMIHLGKLDALESLCLMNTQICSSPEGHLEVAI